MSAGARKQDAPTSAAIIALPAEVLAAQANRSIIPVKLTAEGKKQAAVKWKKWQKGRPSLSQLQRWQHGLCPSMWAIVTGAVSQMVTLDFDGEDGVALAKRLGLEPNVITAGGGWHVYVKHPGYQVKTRQRVLPSLDVRGDGGIAVFHGRTERGEYQLLDAEPRLSIAQLPAELAKLLAAPSLTPPTANSVPVPVVLSDDKAELRKLWQMHRDGEAHPEHVVLPPLWQHPSRAERELHDLLRTRFGLLVRDGRSEPLMLATSEVVREGIVKTQTGASKLLHRFEAEGVVWSPGEMPALGQGNGTRLFLPGPKPVGPEPPGGWRITLDSDGAPVTCLQPGAVTVEAKDGMPGGAVKPVAEPLHQPSVGDAVRGSAAEVINGMAASVGSTERVRSVIGHGGRGYARPMTERLLFRYLAVAGPGNRNRTGHDLAQQVWWNGYSEHEVFRVLLAYQQAVEGMGDHPYTVGEARATVRSVLKQPVREPSGSRESNPGATP